LDGDLGSSRAATFERQTACSRLSVMNASPLLLPSSNEVLRACVAPKSAAFPFLPHLNPVFMESDLKCWLRFVPCFSWRWCGLILTPKKCCPRYVCVLLLCGLVVGAVCLVGGSWLVGLRRLHAPRTAVCRRSWRARTMAALVGAGSGRCCFTASWGSRSARRPGTPSDEVNLWTDEYHMGRVNACKG
jgi:hypothetical protein